VATSFKGPQEPGLPAALQLQDAPRPPEKLVAQVRNLQIQGAPRSSKRMQTSLQLQDAPRPPESLLAQVRNASAMSSAALSQRSSQKSSKTVRSQAEQQANWHLSMHRNREKFERRRAGAQANADKSSSSRSKSSSSRSQNQDEALRGAAASGDWKVSSAAMALPPTPSLPAPPTAEAEDQETPLVLAAAPAPVDVVVPAEPSLPPPPAAPEEADATLKEDAYVYAAATTAEDVQELQQIHGDDFQNLGRRAERWICEHGPWSSDDRLKIVAQIRAQTGSDEVKFHAWCLRFTRYIEQEQHTQASKASELPGEVTK
jgi:hypothetical protein